MKIKWIQWILGFSTLTVVSIANAHIADAAVSSEQECAKKVGLEEGIGKTYVNQHDAAKHCQAKGNGSRLPTARELAIYTQCMGAKGIQETAHVGVSIANDDVKAEIEAQRENGHEAIYASNSSKETVVDSYFNYEGYKRPKGDLGNYWFWSSSVHPYYSFVAYRLDGDVGYFGYYSCSLGDSNGAVRCVQSR